MLHINLLRKKKKTVVAYRILKFTESITFLWRLTSLRICSASFHKWSFVPWVLGFVFQLYKLCLVKKIPNIGYCRVNFPLWNWSVMDGWPVSAVVFYCKQWGCLLAIRNDPSATASQNTWRPHWTYVDERITYSVSKGWRLAYSVSSERSFSSPQNYIIVSKYHHLHQMKTLYFKYSSIYLCV